jgi:hypothetical protein
MKALRTLIRQPASNCVALTYSLDLPFFEYMLFEHLYNGECRNVVLLCDPGQHETALDDVPALTHLGQRYLCLPVTAARAAFHPKLVLLTSDDAGLLLLGSGNLSRAGLTHNREVWTTFRYASNAPDESARAACRWAFEYLGRLEEMDRSPLLRERLDQLWRTTAWLREEPARPEDRDHWLLHNLDRPILEQLLELWEELDGSPVQEVTVVSPYFDRGSLAFEALLHRLRPKAVSVITEHGAPGLNPEGLRRLLDGSGVTWHVRQPEPGPRRLHAKVLALRTERGSWLLTGSPNFSSPAMLRPARGGNAEVAALRYEPDAAYAEAFIDQISEEEMVPLELDWRTIDTEPDGPPDDERPAYRLVRAEFACQKLVVALEPGPPEDARLRVEMIGQADASFETDRWTRDGASILLEPPDEVRALLLAPASLRLLVLGSDGQRAVSSRAVVNNSDALRASSRPVRRQEHGPIPPRLVAGDFEQNIELLSRLQNLLALNPQQLRERRGLSRRVEEDLQREAAMTMEKNEYDPEAMIVDERLRRIEVRTGSEVYVDFYERAFYEDVLAAARAAVYRSLPGTDPEQAAHSQGPSGGDQAPASPPEWPPAMDATAAQRVTASVARLVRNFERGMQDSEYLAQVPPTYLQELFFIMAAFLRGLWRQGLVEDEDFFDLSERLFAAYLGDARGSMGWSAIAYATDGERPTRNGPDPYFCEQCWLHLYLLADYALAEEEGRLPALARLLRRASRVLGPPTILADLPDDVLRAIWRNSFARDRSAPEAQEAANDLNEYSQWYSEETLRQELKESLGVRVIVERVWDWNLPAVPVMRVEGAWSDDHLNTYWQAFAKFCCWPKHKSNARLEVHDSNPALSRTDAKRLVLFYREATRQVSIVVNPNDAAFACRKQTGEIPIEELCNIRQFGEVLLL